jgi:hypothetical protein
MMGHQGTFFAMAPQKCYIKQRQEDTVDHLKRVTDEFGRQAQTFDHWAEKADDQVAARFRSALGGVGQGNLLDVASVRVS